VTAVVGLDVAADAEAWQRAGVRVEDATTWIGGVAIRFVDPAHAGAGDAAVGPTTSAITRWTLLDSPQQPDRIDGLPTSHTSGEGVESWTHPIGATSFDHLVVMTSSIERTCGAIETATGEPLKRVREAGPVRQGFHRLGPVIVEVVESSRVTADTAAFWGLVLIVEDIDEAACRLGPDVISRPKTAVQPGRLIATFRESAGLGMPVAIMSR
jgi:hypothetical protein